MDLLKERIMQEGRCFPGGILKVDSFVNHQMDPILMMDLAKEFVRLFKDIKYNKIITIEASGIAPAIMVGYLTNLPVVFVKKKQPKTMEGMITSVVHSFTKDRDYTVCVSNSYLTPEDHVIFIDDFLANGNASKGVMDLCEKAGAIHFPRPFSETIMSASPWDCICIPITSSPSVRFIPMTPMEVRPVFLTSVSLNRIH